MTDTLASDLTYSKPLAAILRRAQGRTDAETGEPIHIGDEIYRVRKICDEMAAAIRALESEMAELKIELEAAKYDWNADPDNLLPCPKPPEASP